MHGERWTSLRQPACNHTLGPSEGKSSFPNSLSQDRDVFHTSPPRKNPLFQRRLTATIDSDRYEGHRSGVGLRLYSLENICSEAAEGKRQELRTKSLCRQLGGGGG